MQTPTFEIQNLPVLLAPPSNSGEKKERIRFIHLRKHDNTGDKSVLCATGGCTIAYYQIDRNVLYAFAQCKHTDVFSKRIGRMVSSGRLLSGIKRDLLKNFFETVVDVHVTRSEVVKHLTQMYYAYEETWEPTTHLDVY